MFSRFRRSVGRFFNKSRKINHEPINKVSLIVIIIVDLFILANVFAGLDDISRWPMSPQQAYPCHSEWRDYRQSTSDEKDYRILNRVLQDGQWPRSEVNARVDTKHLGSVSEVCLAYDEARDAVFPDRGNLAFDAIPEGGNFAISNKINDVQAEIDSFTSTNSTIRRQYDSTLLEEIAGQPRGQSINSVAAAEAKREIEQNEQAIEQREETLAALKNELVSTPESAAFLSVLSDEVGFTQVKEGYSRAGFWYPSIKLLFQGLFLLPLIAIASAVHRFALRKNYGYVALISWHLLAIFLIPLIWKVFEFFQIGFLFSWLAEIIETLFNGLRFLLNYVQILLIPVIGFGLIKFLQKFVFNTKLQAANRVQKEQCVRCAKKIRKYDVHCPHCSYPQYRECHSCNNLTYKHLPHCKHCGTAQPLDL